MSDFRGLSLFWSEAAGTRSDLMLRFETQDADLVQKVGGRHPIHLGSVRLPLRMADLIMALAAQGGADLRYEGTKLHAENCNTNRLRSNEPDSKVCNCGVADEPGGG